MVDLDKFIISMINSQKRSGYKPDFHWLGMSMIEALKDQGLEYKEGAIVTTSPNIAESDGEKVRKKIVAVIEDCLNIRPQLIEEVDYLQIKDWLEKQGEQKFFINDKVVHKATGKIWTIHHYLKDTNSYYVEDNDGLFHHYRESELKLVEQELAERSKEDEIRLKHILRLLDVKDDKKYILMFGLNSLQDLEKDIAWLKSLKDRVQPQPMQEWDEEDEQMIRNVQNDYHNRLGAGIITQAYHDKVISWLKSLSPKSQWKPSDEQMKALWEVYKGGEKQAALASLYSDLKKLREE